MEGLAKAGLDGTMFGRTATGTPLPMPDAAWMVRYFLREHCRWCAASQSPDE